MFSHKNPTTQQFGPHRAQSRAISSIIENKQRKDHITGIRFNDNQKQIQTISYLGTLRCNKNQTCSKNEHLYMTDQIIREITNNTHDC